MAEPIGAAYVELRASNAKFKEDMAGAARAAAAANNSIRGNMLKSQKAAKRATESLLSMKNAMRVLSVVGAGGFTIAFTKAIRVAADFEQSIANLSAITGATGKDLEFLSNKAREFGATTTLSASQAAVAFKIVASAKPDLLESRDALAAVTREVITLAEAASTDLPSAAKALTGSLNQFNKGAEEASRFINVLAAGAKFGSSEIFETAEALDKVGVIAAQAGLSFEQTNAALQVLAKGNIKASDAGTALRNVLLRLIRTGKDEFNPTLVGLSQALKNVRDAGLSDIEMMKLFEVRTLGAAQEMIQFLPLLDELEVKLTGTSIAYEQAATNTDTLTADVKALGSAFAELQIQLGEKTTPSLREFVQGMTEFLRDGERVRDVGLAIAAAFAAMALNAALARTGLYDIATGSATAEEALGRLAATSSALLTRLAPLLLLYATSLAVIDTYTEAQDRAARATEIFTSVIKPNRAEIEKLGISLDGLDPTNLNRVLEVIRNATAGGLDLAASMRAVAAGLTTEPVTLTAARVVSAAYDAGIADLEAARASLAAVQQTLQTQMAADEPESVISTIQNLVDVEADRVKELEASLIGLESQMADIAARATDGPMFQRVTLDGEDGDGIGGIGLTETEREALAKKLEAIRVSLLSEEAALNESYDRRLETVNTWYDELAIPNEEARRLQIQELEADHQNKLTDLTEKGAKDRQRAEERLNKAVTSARQRNLNLAIGILSTLGRESKAAAIASLIIQKSLAAAGVVSFTQMAIARANAELGLAAAPRVAQLLTQQTLSLGLIAGSAILEGSQIGGGGTGAPTAVTTEAGDSVETTIAPAGPTAPTVNITVIGTLSDNDLRNLQEQVQESALNGLS